MDNVYIILGILLVLMAMMNYREGFPKSYDYIRSIPFSNTNPILEADANAYLVSNGYFYPYVFGDEFYLNEKQMYKNEGYSDLL